MMIRRDRAGIAGFQLAALVDLLFVITFLLIWDRESLMHKRLQQLKVSKSSARTEVSKAESERKVALDTLVQVEKDKLVAQAEVRKLADQLRELTSDKSREKKLERDLHTQFNWMLEGMRHGREGSLALPPPIRALGPGAPESPATTEPARQR